VAVMRTRSIIFEAGLEGAVLKGRVLAGGGSNPINTVFSF